MPNYIDELKSVIALGLPTIGLAFFTNLFLGGLTLIVLSSLDLRVVNKSCTLALACFHFLWFWLNLHFFVSSQIFALGLAMMGLPLYLAT